MASEFIEGDRVLVLRTNNHKLAIRTGKIEQIQSFDYPFPSIVVMAISDGVPLFYAFDNCDLCLISRNSHKQDW